MCKRPAAALWSQSEGIANEILMYFRNKRKYAGDVFISEPIDTDKDGNALTLSDVMTSDENIYDSIDLSIRSEQLYRYMQEVLTERERNILIMRYGLKGRRPMTQREVAKVLGISRSYISRIEKKALDTLKHRFGPQ